MFHCSGRGLIELVKSVFGFCSVFGILCTSSLFDTVCNGDVVFKGSDRTSTDVRGVFERPSNSLIVLKVRRDSSDFKMAFTAFSSKVLIFSAINSARSCRNCFLRRKLFFLQACHCALHFL